MKKAAMAVVSGLVFSLAFAAPALAQSEVTPPEPGGTVITPPGGTAFTGSNVTVWMALAAVALIIGVSLVVVGRRRARASIG